MKVLYFVLSGMRDMADMEQDADLYNSEFLSMVSLSRCWVKRYI